MRKTPETSVGQGAESKENIKLRIIAVPAFGADMKERYLPPSGKTYAPNKTLAYRSKELAREEKITTIFADNVVGVDADYASEVAHPKQSQEFEPTMFWAKELADFVKEKGLNPGEVQIIVVAAPFHQQRCLMDLQSYGFGNVVFDEKMSELGMGAFLDSASDHLQTRYGSLNLIWETGLRTVKKRFPEFYKKLTLSKKKL